MSSFLIEYKHLIVFKKKYLKMDEVRIIEIKENIFKSNEEEADKLRKELKAKKTLLINLMSSPGSGKTTTLMATLAKLKDKYKIAVMEADIDSAIDAKTISTLKNVEAIQLHTGGMCHLTADMTRQGIESLQTKDLDLIIIENVGNLVCPAEFDTGAHVNINILSVPEGDDKPLKYPLMYQVCSLFIINKMDVAPYFDFSLEKAQENIKMRNKDAVIIPISAKKGEGIDELANWLEKEIIKIKGEN